MLQKLYRTIFWTGYSLVMIIAFVPSRSDLHKQTLDLLPFKFHLDQVLHAIVYFLICMYFVTGQKYGMDLFRNNSLKKFLVAIIILAIITEVVQLYVPYRSFNVFDILANLTGIGIGIAVIIPFVRIRRQYNIFLKN
jgi:VanZ family protein